MCSTKLFIILFGCILIYFIPSGIALRLTDYNNAKAKFSLLDPYELPDDTYLIRDIEDLSLNCTCPRVFWPVCGADRETYFNACVLRCINKTKRRRNGPCIEYRRMSEVVFNFKIPTAWRNPNVQPFLTSGDKLEDVLIEFGPEEKKPWKT
ncbi:hypothetical protein PYW07_010470 [Mythimna separata]|uniref:Kazal-like domain-containing protein n=1 Tax=Mythimna separata TaxID=271217 RepID=A0AAD8DMA7_MYTSE|nr:hypothetical protein PYW07_010470 [Mythimna separata]